MIATRWQDYQVWYIAALLNDGARSLARTITRRQTKVAIKTIKSTHTHMKTTTTTTTTTAVNTITKPATRFIRRRQ
jgi:chemotaxis methyl-accepting protein methylase